MPQRFSKNVRKALNLKRSLKDGLQQRNNKEYLADNLVVKRKEVCLKMLPTETPSEGDSESK